jgi:RNA polymerase sigma factor (sigma-70 family)
MAKGPAHALRQHIHHLAGRDNGQVTDRELLQRFWAAQDQPAFETLFRRHAGMVLAVARRVLGAHALDAEDVCQAAFLLLAQKAGSQRWQPSIASWLYKTAHQLALKARTAANRRTRREGRAVPRSVANPLTEITGQELLAVLDEELLALPEALRAPLVLCYLQGATRDEAAQSLVCPLATLKNRLERGRQQLHAALVRRGLGLSSVLLGTLLTQQNAGAAATMSLALTTTEAALALAAGQSNDGVVSTGVSQLLEGVAPMMCWNRFKAALALLLVGGLLSTAAALAYSAADDNQAGPPSKQGSLPKDPPEQRRGVGPARAQGTTLRYRFKKDDRFRYVVERKIESESDASVNVGNKQVRTTETYDVTWRVAGVDNEGNAKMTLTLDRVRYLSDQHFPGKMLEFDSSKHRNPVGLAGMVRIMSPILKAQVGAVFTCTMSPRGEMSDFKVPKKLLDTVKKTRGVSPLYTPQAFKQLLSHRSVVLPRDSIVKGAVWNQKGESQHAGGHATMTVDTRATYQGKNDRDGKKLQEIALYPTATLDRRPPTGLGPFTLKNQEGKGSMFFDNTTGRLLETESSLTLDMISNPRPGQMIAWKVKHSLSAKLVEQK